MALTTAPPARAPTFPQGMGPLASEATTPHQGSCTFSQVCPRLPWRPRPHLHNRALHRRHRGFLQGREVLLSGLALRTSRRTVSGSHGRTQTRSWSQNAHPGLKPRGHTQPEGKGCPAPTSVCPGSGICQVFMCLPGKQSQWGSIHAGDGSLSRRPRPQGAVVQGQCSRRCAAASASL